MARCWIGVALIAFAIEGTAFGQDPYLPLQQNKPAVMPEPTPCFESPLATMPPRPALMPDTPNSLPANTINAWCDEYCAPPAIYVELGYLGLMREKLHRRPVALPDNVNGGVDTGGLPDLTAAPVADFRDIEPRMGSGVRATVGCHWDSYALEASGFYIAQSQASKTYASIGRLDSFFNVNGNVFVFPLGFEGNNGMWLQDDIIRTSLQTSLASGEVNFKFWPHVFGDVNLLVGVRYLDIYERVGIFAGDDDLTAVDVNGNPNPVLQANYTATAHNRIVGGQLGVEWNKPICCWLAYSMVVKGAWGVNLLDVNTQLTRGDGFQGPAGHYSTTNFSHLYEAGFFFNFPLMENIHVRAGYNLLWVLDITNATDVVDFNLANTGGRHDPHGSSFYHGPSVEFEILF
jgi:hypothetical protein